MKTSRIIQSTSIITVSATLVLISILTGCGASSHRACTGGPLSTPEMQFTYRANDRLLDDHIYFSKEASSGGRGFGGGGCGCN